MPSTSPLQHNPVTLDRIEAGLRVIARCTENNSVYLPLFERLMKERKILLEKQESMKMVRQWAEAETPL